MKLNKASQQRPLLAALDLKANGASMYKKIYSPLQSATAAFFGGPIAAVAFVRENFITLSKPELAKKSLYLGSLVTTVVLLLLPFLPEKFPSFAIPMLLGISTRIISEKYQLTKQVVAESEEYEFHSNWRVLGFSLLFSALFFGIGVAYFMILAILGVQL